MAKKIKDSSSYGEGEGGGGEGGGEGGRGLLSFNSYGDFLCLEIILFFFWGGEGLCERS